MESATSNDKFIGNPFSSRDTLCGYKQTEDGSRFFLISSWFVLSVSPHQMIGIHLFGLRVAF